MEASVSAGCSLHVSKKRVFTGSGSGSGSSAFMEEEVIEIAPPPQYSKSKSLKQKEVICPEVINVDSDDDADDIMIIGEKMVPGKDKLSNGVFPQPHITIGDGSSDDMAFNDDDVDLYFNELMYDDECAMLQAHFDSVDIPPGVEATVPWWPSSGISNSHTSLASSANLSGSSFLPNAGPSGVYHNEATTNPVSESKQKPSISSAFEQSNFSAQSDDPSSTFWSKMYMASWPPFTGSHGQTIPASSSGQYISPSGSMMPHPSNANSGNAASSWKYAPKTVNAKVGEPSQVHPGAIPVHQLQPWGFPVVHKMNSFMSHLSSETFAGTFSGGYSYRDPSVALDQGIAAEITVPDFVCSGQDEEGESHILKKFQAFKKFDTVEDHSGHHFSKKKQLSKQPSKAWVKKIQDEWRMLENDLPDTIFVRVYETRMDLLRAVIIGAEGTPYHDGMYFFDVSFPSSYPNTPPQVNYHSRGLRINPNLYNCGKVCLSLLNTWSGHGNEKWVAGVSTALQLLVSIQGLILNSEPYFNEPGYAGMVGTPSGKKSSKEYSENTFLLSLKTMLYTLRQPPQHFEELVYGHFFKRAHNILAACRAYLDGVQVGSLVNGEVGGADKGKKGPCSQLFKRDLPQYINSLCEAFAKIGVKDLEKYSVSPVPNEMMMSTGSRCKAYTAHKKKKLL